MPKKIFGSSRAIMGFLLLYTGVITFHLSAGIPSYTGEQEIQAVNRIVIIGDTQVTPPFLFWKENNYEKTRAMIREIVRRKPSLVINLGDLVTWGASYRDWEKFDTLHELIRKHRIPYYPVLGNHDYNGEKHIALLNYFKRFPHLKKRKWYSFTWHSVGFIMLDSNFLRLKRPEKRAQKSWYVKELDRLEKNERIRHVIVCCHHPPFTNALYTKPSRTLQKHYLGPFLKSGKTRAFFSGHCHSYEKFKIKGKFFIVSGGGGGTRSQLNTQVPQWEDQFDGPSVRFMHFCELQVQQDHCEMQVVKLHNPNHFTTIDNWNLPSIGDIPIILPPVRPGFIPLNTEFQPESQ